MLITGQEFWNGLERLTGPAFDHQLVQEWVPAVPGLESRLRAGARVADVGTGTGVAPMMLARAFPKATVNGFDIHPSNVERATRAARDAGVADRVRFEQADAVKRIPGRYDVITMFAVVYGLSLLHCMPQSLEQGGAALGACGLPESRLRALCLDAGFRGIERAWEGPLDAVYAATL